MFLFLGNVSVKAQSAYQYGANLFEHFYLIIAGEQALVDGDYSTAIDNFIKAGEKNYADGAYYLGLCCELGFGVQRDCQKAHNFYTIASNMGYTEAKQALNRIAREGYYSDTDANRNKVRSQIASMMAQRQANNEAWRSANGSGIGSSSSGSSSSSSSSSSPQYVDEIVYTPDYTGNATRVYCSKCGTYMYPHSHIKKRIR
ncbi:MAG: hypothetical protein LUC88_03080 [Prevotella sp.]|nr:hypothetical protein [Prevotella sp.]